MSPEVEVLDPAQTEAAMVGHRFGKTESMLAQIEAALAEVVDTEGSVFVTTLKTNGQVNALRTRLYRRDVAIQVRKITYGSQPGRLIKARRIKPEERG